MTMRGSLAACGAALLLALPIAAQGLPNFSGTWTLDAAKSDFGKLPPPESIVLVIDHQDPRLTVSTTQKGPNGEASNTDAYTTDGKPNVNKARGPAGEPDITSTTTWNGNVLVTKRVIAGQVINIGTDDTMELGADGRTLMMTRTLKTPQGDFRAKVVFKKK